MADRARCDLPYGHFGRGTYSPDDHSWFFERSLTFSSTTQLLEEPKNLSQSSYPSSFPDRAAHQEGPPSKRHQKQIKALKDSIHHLPSVSTIISPLLRVSEAARNASHQHDSLKGSSIAFGDIPSHRRNRPIPVAAYISGDTGCDLCVIQVQKQKRGWDEDRRCWLEVPSFHGEQANWSSHAGPIQQIHFTSNLRPGPAILAVRLITRTTIVRVLQAKGSSEETQGSSITLSNLYDVELRETGGFTHADVTFNPWFAQHVALVDISGKWTVLEFSTRSMGHVARTWSGMVRKSSFETGSSINDGWGRISWVLNLGTLAVCTRESLTLINITNDDPIVVEEVELGLSGAVPWILDFLVLPEPRDHFLVLTTTHILVYKLTEDKRVSNKTANIRFRVRHYMNPEDLSLRLSTWTEDDGEVIGILLYSNLLGLLSSYRFAPDTAQPAVTVDCMDLLLPIALTSANNARSNVCLGLYRVELASKSLTRLSDHPLGGARFFSALVNREGMGTYQTLFCIGSDGKMPPLAWEAKLATSSFKLSRHDFVVDDSSLEFEEATVLRGEPSSRRSRRAKLQDFPSAGVIDLKRVAAHLQSPSEEREPFADVLATVKTELERLDLYTTSPMRTLYQFADTELDVRDVEDCSAAFEQLSAVAQESQTKRSSDTPADMDEQAHYLTLAPVELPSSLGLEHLQLDDDLSTVYDRTIAAWITPLSDSVPGRIRLARARLCGLVAAQLVLASRSIRVEDPPEAEPSQEQTQTQTQSQVSGFQPGGHGGFALSQLDSSQPFPSSALPTPSQTPSITTASSRPSSFAAPELNRLSKYTTFSKPPPPALPRSLNNVLSHWNVGEDVKDYDWMSTSRKLTQQDEDADNDMTEADRRRAQRRAERHMRRQRKEAAASQALQIASSQAPEIFSASQPAGRRIESQPSGKPASSQFTGLGTGAAAASQVEAGRFGGRPAAPTGKKRRRQGF